MLETFKLGLIDISKRTVLGDTLSDTDNEGNLGLEGLLDTGSGQRRTENIVRGVLFVM